MEAYPAQGGVGAVILAGGKSVRMGRDKALLPLGEGTYASHLAETLREHFDFVILITHCPGAHRHLGLSMFEDLHPGFGPLSGVEAAFERVDARALLFIPVDMPLFTLAGVRALRDQTGSVRNACFHVEGRIEPLPCLLTRPWWASVRGELWGDGAGARRGLKALLEASAPICLDGHPLLVEDPHAFESANTPLAASRVADRLRASR
jgi:molybdopterin-guanine dinucleotide biosynthesis protein A